MVRYYKLFDLLNRMGMKKTDLKEILSSRTIAKLSKGEYLSGEAIEKICIFLNCQPGDIMEILESEKVPDGGILTTKNILEPQYNNEPVTETYYEKTPNNIEIELADELGLTERQLIERNDW